MEKEMARYKVMKILSDKKRKETGVEREVIWKADGKSKAEFDSTIEANAFIAALVTPVDDSKYVVIDSAAVPQE